MPGSPYDKVILEIANYVHSTQNFSSEAYRTARLALADAIGCSMLALNFPACTKLLGPMTAQSEGIPIPGTRYIADPITAAFNIGLMIRWLDFNDTWLAQEWGHPSDNLGGLLSIGYWKGISVKDLLHAMVQAYEIQGILALGNSFNKVGLDHVILVKVATAAVCTRLMGGTKEQTCAAISQAFIDLCPLRTYRHAPNTGSRKSWASGDATGRGVFLAWLTLKGEMGYPSALTAPKWGFQDALFHGKELVLERSLGSYVMENILFKVQYPAEFHAQTAVEAAIKTHETCAGKLDDIERIEIETHESALRIIDKKGPLKNPADRDHCLQYMVAIGLIHGYLEADHYEDEAAQNRRIDELRNKMVISENVQYSKDYLDPSKRSIANALTIHYKNGEKSERIEIEYPLGHRHRRQEALQPLLGKLKRNLRTQFSSNQTDVIVKLFYDYEALYQTAVPELFSYLKQGG